VFYVVPDRGPNGDAINVDGVTNREFLVPTYQARAVKIELNTASGNLRVLDQILFTRKDGATPITGIPNIEGWDEVPLDGHLWTCDEYRPAIYHFAADGTLIERYVPEGTAQLGDTPQAEGFYGAETLPTEYRLRRANRGFEAIALDTENDIVYAFIQTPMYNPDSSTGNNSDVIRILGIISFSQPNGIDASNRDDAINITNWPVHGLFLPDAIAAYQADGETYIVSVNEGDARDYDGFSEEERVGGIMIYDITDPKSPQFVTYEPARNFDGDPEADTALDLGPEGIVFVPASQSPVLAPMLVVSNEVSGSTAFYKVNTSIIDEPTAFRSTSAGGGAIQLAWNTPTTPPESIIVQRRETGSKQWSTFATFDGNQDSLIVSNAVGFDFRALSKSGSASSAATSALFEGFRDAHGSVSGGLHCSAQRHRRNRCGLG